MAAGNDTTVLAATLVVVLASACGHPSEPTATGTTGSGTPPPSTEAACSAGDPCAPEGSTCTPIPLGTGWSHALACTGGRWSDLEIAPLPQPPPPP